MRVVVVGDTGLLGQAVVRRFVEGHEVLGVSTQPSSSFITGNYNHIRLDLSLEMTSFSYKVKIFKPDLLINCAGLVDVKKCEELKKEAFFLNAALPGLLAEFSKSEGIFFIHISTDHIFNGKKTAPYSEQEPPDPLNYYGETKLQGEMQAVSKNPKTLIVRTNIVGLKKRASSPTFGEWLVESLFRGDPIILADDFVTSSIHVDSLADLLIRAYSARVSGILNIASSEPVSKYSFGKWAADALGIEFTNVKRGKLSDLNLFPRRPSYLGLDIQLAEDLLQTKMPSAHEAVLKLTAECLLHKKELLFAKKK